MELIENLVKIVQIWFKTNAIIGHANDKQQQPE